MTSHRIPPLAGATQVLMASWENCVFTSSSSRCAVSLENTHSRRTAGACEEHGSTFIRCDKWQHCVSVCVCVCLHSAQVRHLFNLFETEFCKLLSCASGRSQALINWDNWCLSRAAGRLTHTVTGGCKCAILCRKRGGRKVVLILHHGPSARPKVGLQISKFSIYWYQVQHFILIIDYLWGVLLSRIHFLPISYLIYLLIVVALP